LKKQKPPVRAAALQSVPNKRGRQQLPYRTFGADSQVGGALPADGRSIRQADRGLAMRFRRKARFVRDPLAVSTPLDRNARARIIHFAETYERNTKAPGQRMGALGLTGLAVLKALLFQFMGRGGLTCPSYTALQRATGLCRQTIARALDRLERAGIIKRIQRIVRERTVDQGRELVVARQGSNLYSFMPPEMPTKWPSLLSSDYPRTNKQQHGLGKRKPAETGVPYFDMGSIGDLVGARIKKLSTEQLDWRASARLLYTRKPRFTAS